MFFNIHVPLVLFLTSFVGLMIGAAFKVQHWAGGSTIFGSMLMVKGIAIVWLVVILLVKKK